MNAGRGGGPAMNAAQIICLSRHRYVISIRVIIGLRNAPSAQNFT